MTDLDRRAFLVVNGRYLPGMRRSTPAPRDLRILAGDAPPFGPTFVWRRLIGASDADGAWMLDGYDAPSADLLDTTDPATRGCLHALADPYCHVYPDRDGKIWVEHVIDAIEKA